MVFLRVVGSGAGHSSRLGERYAEPRCLVTDGGRNLGLPSFCGSPGRSSKSLETIGDPSGATGAMGHNAHARGALRSLAAFRPPPCGVHPMLDGGGSSSDPPVSLQLPSLQMASPGRFSSCRSDGAPDFPGAFPSRQGLPPSVGPRAGCANWTVISRNVH